MRSKFASSLLSALLYTQGLLGFAGVATIVMKDFGRHEPVFVKGADTVIPANSRW